MEENIFILTLLLIIVQNICLHLIDMNKEVRFIVTLLTYTRNLLRFSSFTLDNTQAIECWQSFSKALLELCSRICRLFLINGRICAGLHFKHVASNNQVLRQNDFSYLVLSSKILLHNNDFEFGTLNRYKENTFFTDIFFLFTGKDFDESSLNNYSQILLCLMHKLIPLLLIIRIVFVSFDYCLMNFYF